jgi:hypothetical protein
MVPPLVCWSRREQTHAILESPSGQANRRQPGLCNSMNFSVLLLAPVELEWIESAQPAELREDLRRAVTGRLGSLTALSQAPNRSIKSRAALRSNHIP